MTRQRRKPNQKRKTNKKDKATVPLTPLEQAASDESLGKEEHTPLASPCRLHIHSKRRRLVDCDGVSAKAAIDSLVLAGLLEDDGPSHIDTSISYSQEKVSKDEIEETMIFIYQEEKGEEANG